jgi:murein L,D-transpeptidase YafK
VHNPNSAFHLSLGVSYPNAKDTDYAELLGKAPGGEIFIHGQPNNGKKKKGSDWTAGCIAVKNSHIRQLYSMIKNGTEIYINP